MKTIKKINLTEYSVSIEKLSFSIANKKGITLFIARADRVHPLASGNKLYKLLPNMEYALLNNYSQLLSFGGAFSNHIHALALYSEAMGLESIAIIRGEKEYANNPTLTAVIKAGMQLEFVNRITYKRRYSIDYLDELQQKYPNALIIPEGGSSELALQGCVELMRQINKYSWQQQKIIADVITVACGTGMTFSGLVKGAKSKQQIKGYRVVKDLSVKKKVDKWLAKDAKNKNHTIEAADFGGYAKFDGVLLNFIVDFLQQTGVLLDPIYTSKMCRAVCQQIEVGQFEAGTQLLMVHTGGLQAWYGMKNKVIAIAGNVAWQKIEAYLSFQSVEAV